MKNHKKSIFRSLHKIYRNMLIFVFFTVFLSCAFAQSESLFEQMEKVLQRHASLSSFLADARSVEEYFQLARQYYGGERFRRESYNAVLHDLREILTVIPELNQRIWALHGKSDSFELVVNIKSYGRDFSPSAWSNFLTDLKKDLKRKSAHLMQMDASSQKETIKQSLLEFERKRNDLESKIAQAQKKSEKIELRTNGFQELFQDQKLQEIEAYLLLKKLESENMKEIFDSSDADFILDVWNEFQQNTKILAEELPIELRDIGEKALGQAKRHLPTINTLLDLKKVFIPMMQTVNGRSIEIGTSKKSQVHVFRIRRIFHAILKGIAISECVGGAYGETGEGLKSLTAERYLTAALDGSQVWYGEKNERFSGYFEANPIQRQGQNSIYGASHFFLPLLRQKTMYQDPQSGSSQKVSVYELFMKQMREHKPFDWQGYTVSQSHSFNNSGMVRVVHQSPSYVRGSIVGPSSEFHSTDPLVGKIIAYTAPRNKEHALTYGGRMIIDGLVPDSGKITQLDLHQPLKFQSVQDFVSIFDEDKEGQVYKLVDALFFNKDLIKGFDLRVLQTPHILNRLFSEVKEDGDNDQAYRRQLDHIYRTFQVIAMIYQKADALPLDVINRISGYRGMMGRKFEFSSWVASGSRAAVNRIRSAYPGYAQYLWETFYKPASFFGYTPFHSPNRQELLDQLKSNPNSSENQNIIQAIFIKANLVFESSASIESAKEGERYHVEADAHDLMLLLFEAGIDHPKVYEFGKALALGHINIWWDMYVSRTSGCGSSAEFHIQYQAAKELSRRGYDIGEILLALSMGLEKEFKRRIGDSYSYEKSPMDDFVTDTLQLARESEQPEHNSRFIEFAQKLDLLADLYIPTNHPTYKQVKSFTKPWIPVQAAKPPPALPSKKRRSLKEMAISCKDWLSGLVK